MEKIEIKKTPIADGVEKKLTPAEIMKNKLKKGEQKETPAIENEPKKKLQVLLTETEQKNLKLNAKKKGFGTASSYARFLMAQDGAFEL
jgi:hypothetical protein